MAKFSLVAFATYFASVYAHPSGDNYGGDGSGLAASEILNDPYPYYFPQLNADASHLFPMPLCHGFQLEEATIDQIQAALAHGRLTSEQLVTCYLTRNYQVAEYIK